MALLLMAFGLAGCDRVNEPDPNYEYVMIRMEELEGELSILKLQVERLSGEADDASIVGRSEQDEAPVVLGESSLDDVLIVESSGGTGLESQVEEIAARRDSLGLRVRQLENAPRAALPELLGKMGVTTPALSSLQAERRGLMGKLATQPAGGANGSNLGEEMRRIELRIELEADRAREELLEREQAESARVSVLMEGLGLGSSEGLGTSGAGVDLRVPNSGLSPDIE